jgi:hypothetical protein
LKQGMVKNLKLTEASIGKTATFKLFSAPRKWHCHFKV